MSSTHLEDAHDTIAAIATASGGGVGIVRVSGPNAPAIAKQFLGHLPTPRHAHVATFRDVRGRNIDRGLLLVFAAPASFTGEDVLELHAHGNAVVLEVLLARVCELGSRRARAGEFSERAFLNGKFDLTQVEAVADLIAAGSERQARAAMRSLDGAFSRHIDALLAALTRLRVHVEAAIDFTDEDIDFLADPALVSQIDLLQTRLAELILATRGGQQLRDGLYVVITGPPNVGKSSLLNALARSDRAIVTATPGTTRDVLRETVMLGGARIELVDTAGLRDTEEAVEAEGVRRAHAERARADMVIEVREASRDDDSRNPSVGAPGPGAILPEPRGSKSGVIDCASVHDARPQSPSKSHSRAKVEAEISSQRIIVHNKIDLADIEPRVEFRAGIAHAWLSAHDGRGIDQLERLLADAAGGGDATRGTFSARARHVDALERTQLHLDAAATQLTGVRAGELAAEDLRQAQQALGEITGAFTPDDLLARVFSTFCIGK